MDDLFGDAYSFGLQTIPIALEGSLSRPLEDETASWNGSQSNVKFEIDDEGSETDLGDHSDDVGPRKTSCSSVEFELNTCVQLGGEFPQLDPRNNDQEIQQVPQSASVAMAPGSIQTGEKLFPCTECSKTYNKRYNLQLHMRSHTGERLYVCGECDKRFTEQSKLNAHMRIHAGDKRYICAECDKRFTKKFSLDCHKKTHDKNRPLSSSFRKTIFVRLL